MAAADSSDSPSRPSSLDLTLLVPTRNEAGNVGDFVKRVAATLDERLVSWEVVFADDSDDDTPSVIAELAATGFPIHVVHRRPGERGGSISGALQFALPVVSGTVVAVIDADLQHPPEVLPRLAGPVLAGVADVAIGTRYRGAGSAEGLESPFRRFASHAASATTRVMFPSLRGCSDSASGLFAFRRDLVDSVELRPLGFKFLIELLIRGAPEKIAEVPYVFESRSGGLSNARLLDGAILLRHLLRLRLEIPPRPASRVIFDPVASELPLRDECAS